MKRRMQELVQYGVDEALDVLPHYTKPDGWISSFRVLFAFSLPLLVGLIAQDLTTAFPIALSAGMVALVDPRGSREHRGITMLAAIFGGFITFVIGSMVIDNPLGRIFFVIALGMILGLGAAFGTAGVRAAYMLITCGFMGSSAGLNGPAINSPALLSGGIIAIILAFAFFSKGDWYMHTKGEKANTFARNFKDHITMKTAIGRHAYRIAISMGLAGVICQVTGFANIELAATAAAALYFPTSPVFYKRGVRFFISSTLAVFLSFLVVTKVHNVMGVIFFVGLALFFAVAMRAKDYAFFSFANTIFYITIVMLSTGVGGWDLLANRIVSVVIGIGIAILVATMTLPARERIALISEMELPLPAADKIDDPVIASMRTREVIRRMYRRGIPSAQQPDLQQQYQQQKRE